MNPKPGWKTTEFWLTLATVFLPFLAPGVSPDVLISIAGGVTAIYTAARAYAKAKK